jgi:hypothetical protein
MVTGDAHIDAAFAADPPFVSRANKEPPAKTAHLSS